jgi:hypothetical protein
MPTAIAHAPPFTVPGSSTSTALVRWNGTGGNQIQDSTILVGATTMGLAADTDLVTFSSGTLTIAGTVAATTLTGAGAGITALAAANITASGTLPALNGAALTALTAANITASGTLPVLNGSALTNLDADDIATGTVPPARLGSGSSITTKFLRGDGSWQPLTSAAITGTSTGVDNRVAVYDGTTTLEGLAGLTFDGTALVVTGTGISQIQRTTSGTTTISAPVHISNKTSQNAADGFGPVINFQMTDTGVTDQQMGYIGFERHGADNSARFIVNVMNAGSLVEGLLMDNTGAVTMPLQPAFVAKLTAGETNVTGDSTIWYSYTGSNNWTSSGSGLFDQNSDFDDDGRFTAPVDGRYMVGAELFIQGIQSGSTHHTYSDGLTEVSNGNFVNIQGSAGRQGSGAGAWAYGWGQLADMDEGDIYTFHINVYYGNKSIDIQAYHTRMWAYLVA